METRLYLRLLSRSWWLILLVALVALNIALAASYFAVPMYRATARFLVMPNVTPTDNAGQMLEMLNVLDKRSIVTTYAEVMGSRRIREDTFGALGVDPVAGGRDYEVTTVVLPDASVVELAVMGPDPVFVATLANTVGQKTIDFVSTLYQVYRIDVLDSAVPATAPTSPQPLRDAGVALVLGIVLGVVLAVVREQLHVSLEVLRQQARLDSTSLAFNRRYFQQRLEESCHQPGAFSLALIEYDGLADLTNTMPRAMIQNLLRQATQTIRAELRGNDIIGRWNAAQMAVLLPNTPGQTAVHVLERVQRSLSQPVPPAEGADGIQLAPRVGVVVNRANEPASALARRAQGALEQARETPSRPLLV